MKILLSARISGVGPETETDSLNLRHKQDLLTEVRLPPEATGVCTVSTCALGIEEEERDVRDD